MAICSTLGLWFSGGLGLLVQEPVPKETAVVQQESAESSPTEAPLTWKALLGEGEVPENYPMEPLKAIDGLNKTVGSWGFAGKQLRDGKDVEFEAVMQVQGGLSSDQISLGSMPMWQITIHWPVKEPEQKWHMTLVPGLNPDGVEWLLFSALSSDGETKATGEKKFFKGAWDPASRTLTWKPKAPLVPGAESGQDQEVKGREFQMIISENGGLQIKHFQQDDSHQISGQSVVRLGEYVKPGTDLKILKMLPNGYKMFFASSSEVLLVHKENGVVAGARVDKIGCSGNLIFGLITQRDRVEKPDQLHRIFKDPL